MSLHYGMCSNEMSGGKGCGRIAPDSAAAAAADPLLDPAAAHRVPRL